ncbi:MAG: cardiolipin synthase [Alcaligenaceae bacterium]|nr:cardiolipin synthase [Alcaligenaceae bacterium]
MKAFWAFLLEYQTHLLFGAGLAIGLFAASHAAMTKRDVRAAIAWVGVIILSPFFGAFLYLLVGINRIRRGIRLQHPNHFLQDQLNGQYQETGNLETIAGQQFISLKKAGDTLSRFQAWSQNEITPLFGGDETYAAMIAAIDRAHHSIAMQSYIFDNDVIGRRIAQALIRAKQRGVTVKILIDAVGVRYSRPPVIALFKGSGIDIALFQATVLLFKMPYANLRSHRKILVIDGQLAFAGGMNIRECFTSELGNGKTMKDTHFRIQGPLSYQLLTVFIHDWAFTTHEKLVLQDWIRSPLQKPQANIAARCITSGPDSDITSTHKLIQAACAVAQKHIRIQSPYFLPDQVLLGALNTAARRGVRVDILVPGENNLKLVHYAMLAQLDQVMESGCHVWQSKGPFDHSKLFTVDDSWSLIGSSNWDARSLRLNFEADIEIYDKNFSLALSRHIDEEIRNATRISKETLKSASYLKQLRNKIIWLASPYL